MSGSNSALVAMAAIADLRAANISNLPQNQCYVLGYTAPGDGGDGFFWHNASDTTSSDNGGTIIVDVSDRRWYLQISNNLVDVRSFGVTANGTTDDSAAIALAVTAAKAENFAIFLPNGTINMEANTLVLSGLPQGFTIKSHANSRILYSGTGTAVQIDSVFLADIEFGIIQGNGNGGNTNGLEVIPFTVGPNGQVACVLSSIKFNQIAGFQISLYLNCSTGSIAQCRFSGMSIESGGNLPANSLGGSIEAIQVTGTSPFIFQGNELDVNYIQAGKGGFADGAIWTGIASGNSTWGPMLNNANTFKFGAVDGEGYGDSFGINESGMFNIYIGQLDDLETAVQLEATSKYISLVVGIIDINSGGTYVNNLSSSTFSAYSLFSPTGFRYSQSGYETTNQFGNQTLVQSGQITLTESTQTFSFNNVAFAQAPVIVGSCADGTAPGTNIDVKAISGEQFTVHGSPGQIVNWIAWGFITAVQSW